MNKVISSKRILIGIISILLAFILTFMVLPDNIDGLYKVNYIVDAWCAIVCVFLCVISYQKKKIDLFSPATLFTALYVGMFFITPIYDIVNQEYYWFGKKSERFSISIDNTEFNEKVNSKTLLFIVIGYFVCLAANIYYLVFSSGVSITYVLSLGMLGKVTSKSEIDIGAISMLSYALPSFTLLYISYGEKRIFKIISFILMFELQVARGFRFFILQIVVMFGSYYFLKNRKKPNVFHVILGVSLTLVPLVLMTLFRTTIRAGMGIDVSDITTNSITDALDAAFWDNLRIYKNYYALVKVVPEQTPYLFGAQTIAYTMIMFIPRALWPGKPGNPGTIAQKIALGQTAVLGGSAYPALGEYYYDFGLLGIIVWMSIWGFFLKRIEDRYRFNRKSHIDLMIYSTILGTVLQFTIRGYMPSNFWMLVFCVLPYWIVKRMKGKR